MPALIPKRSPLPDGSEAWRILKGRKESVQSKAKRVAMIGHKFIPSRDGGVEVVVSSLAPHLAEIGYDVTCYNRTGKQFRERRKNGTLPAAADAIIMPSAITIQIHTPIAPFKNAEPAL